LRGWLQGAEINTDKNLRLQYLAGVGLNNYTASDIFSEIAKFRTFPETLFNADDGWKSTLRQAMGVAP
jgi:spermidine synthase